MTARRQLRCEKLPGKLLQIRQSLKLTQFELADRLGLQKCVRQLEISRYETGKSEPPILVVLAYARLVGISTDVLIDDEQELPKFGH